MLRIGVLTPHAAAGPEEELPAMAPGSVIRVVRVSSPTVAAGSPTIDAARAWTSPPLLDDAAALLAAEPVDVIGYASTSSGYAIGFDHEVALAARLRQRSGVPVAATCVAAVDALRSLKASRIAVVNPPWFDNELNELGAKYFESQGLAVVSTASADLPNDPTLIRDEAVAEWTAQHVPDEANAVFIGGNGFRSAGSVAGLEAAIGRPVLTSNQVLLWRLLALAGAAVEVKGFGRLFAHHPASRPTTGVCDGAARSWHRR